MRYSRPGKLSLRAITQYRRRDVLSYLGLRYYLGNSAAKSDLWIQKVAANLTLTRTPKYYLVEHFKEIQANGTIKRRKIYLPSPNDSLAETALLDECSKYPEIFGNPKSVFSYDLAIGEERQGVFKNYIKGLRKRQREIAKACKTFPEGIVEHTDIENFYPSIGTNITSKVWMEKCRHAQISKRFVDLGLKFIDSYAQIEVEGKAPAIIVGPMFSHFLANMILHDLDREFEKSLPVAYFRYVDDMTFVGDEADVKEAIGIVREAIASLGLVLHADDSRKNVRGSTIDWMNYKSDFLETGQNQLWKRLIGSLKLLLISKPNEMQRLEKAFREKNIGLPIYHYYAIANEKSAFENLKSFPRLFISWTKTRGLSTEYIIKQAESLRDQFLQDVEYLSDKLQSAKGFQRKSLLPKIRYKIGRLIYLCSEEQLLKLSNQIIEVPELKFYVTLMDAIVSGNIDTVLDLGADVAQATAQLFKAVNKIASFTDGEQNSVRQHGIAIFIFNGVELSAFKNASSELQKLAAYGADSDLMNSQDGFIRELACLHGLGEKPRHSITLESIFDKDEDFVFDVLDNFETSLS